MGWYGQGMGLSGWLFMTLLLVGLLGLIGWLATRSLPASNPGPATGSETAADILDKRFARGEIDEQAYTAQRTALEAARAGRRRDAEP